MAVPATKRRKLSHSPSLDGIEDGQDEDMQFEDESIDDEDEVEDEDEDEVEDEDEEEDDEEEDEEVEEDSKEDEKKNKKETKTAKYPTKPPPKRTAASSASNNLHASAAAYTGGTFKSNMFKMQLDEILGHIRPRHGKREKTAEETLHKLKKIIEAIPAREPLPLHDAERQLIKQSKVSLPFPNPRPAHDVKYKLAYAKPATINVVGAYPLNLTDRSDKFLAIDMLVTMPSSLLQDKDYINHRYFYKRAYFIACIAAGLKSTASDLTAKFANFNDNPLHPILVVSPKSKKAENNWQINIIPAIPKTAFPNDKLLPSKNCVRPVKSDGTDDSTTVLPPTPFYNASLQADAQFTAYLTLLKNASTTCDGFNDACLLGRIWLRQRGLTSHTSKGGFGNFEWAALLAILLQTGAGNGLPLLSSGYSSYQLFKATLQYLAAKDLVKQPAILQADALTLTSVNGAPIFFDGLRSINLLYKMTASSYHHIRTEARTTLVTLSDSLIDTFEPAFILRVDNNLQRHDVTVKLPLAAFPAAESEDRQILARSQSIHAVLTRGLGDRASQVQLVLPSQEPWEINSARPSSSRKGELLINITLNPANVHRTVDHGPSAENKKEAAEFRKFWGEKSELRRFRDGAILESLVWSTKEGGLPIIQQIVTWLLWRHFGKPVAEQAVFFADDFAKLIKHSNGIAAFQPIMEAFKTLETDLRAMDDLPLTIRSLMPADSQLRYSSISVPADGNTQMKTPADVVIQFEGSGRWPDDLIAIQRTKVAFLLQIATLYSKTNPDVTARVGLENQDLDFENQAFLDITYPATSSSFRLRIHHDREQTLLERTLKDKTSAPSTRESASHALASYKRLYMHSPAHTAAVQKLCTRHPALSPTIRVLKHWFSSHLLTNHFSPELIELIAVNTFTRPHPFSVPSSVRTAFTRTLAFLSRWDWRADPLIVSLSSSSDNDLTAPIVATATTRFEAWRKLDPAMNRVALFVASSLDTDGTTWTDGVPAKVVAGRLSALARAATLLVEKWDLLCGAAAAAAAAAFDVEALFARSETEYDFLIRLTPLASSSSSKKSKRKISAFKNLAVAEEGGGVGAAADPEMVGFKPRELFFAEVERIYGQAVVLFRGEEEEEGEDDDDDDVFAGLWTPYTSARGWKVNLAYATVPKRVGSGGEDDDDEEIVAELDKEGVVKEIARLGGELVRGVVMK